MSSKEPSIINFPDTEPKIYRAPILAFSEATLPQPYAAAAWEEVQKVLELSGQNRKSKFFGSRKWQEGNGATIDDYVAQVEKQQTVNHNQGFGSQLNVEILFDTYEKELIKADPQPLPPHLRILMFNRDLCGDHTGWGFGLTDASLGLEVVSAKRFLAGKYPEALALSMWRRLLRHETAHLFGLVRREKHVAEKLGRHCTNICCMRQGMSMAEWQLFTEEELRKGIEFCDDCQTELKEGKLFRGK
jgi:predicted Zn-dependent protease